jgi:hypothetical protein
MDSDDANHDMVSASFCIKFEELTLRSDPPQKRAHLRQNNPPVNSKYDFEMVRNGTHSSTSETSRNLPYDELDSSRDIFRALAELAVDS